MKVIIEIPDMDVKILSQWASVSRTLNEAKRHCGYSAISNDDEHARYRADVCEDELNEIEPALNRLHQSVRNEIWQMNHDNTR